MPAKKPPTFADLRAEYAQLWATMTVDPVRVRMADQIVARIVTNRARYEVVERDTSVPWFVVAVIHALEAGLLFTKHLHNGDPLTARTKLVPAGHPKTGNPPFTWEFSAADALRLKGLDKNRDWSAEKIAFLLEAYNGWGYRQYHPDTKSPYLWSFSNQYRAGKYIADGKWDPTAVSEQCGAMVLLKRMEQLGHIRLGASAPSAPSPTSEEPLQKGDKGERVREAQNRLIAHGFPPVDGADGDFGGNTEDAVRRFKAARGLPADGLIDAPTWRALRAASAPLQSPQRPPAPEPAAPSPSTPIATGAGAGGGALILGSGGHGPWLWVGLALLILAGAFVAIRFMKRRK